MSRGSEHWPQSDGRTAGPPFNGRRGDDAWRPRGRRERTRQAAGPAGAAPQARAGRDGAATRRQGLRAQPTRWTGRPTASAGGAGRTRRSGSGVAWTRSRSRYALGDCLAKAVEQALEVRHSFTEQTHLVALSVDAGARAARRIAADAGDDSGGTLHHRRRSIHVSAPSSETCTAKRLSPRCSPRPRVSQTRRASMRRSPRARGVSSRIRPTASAVIRNHTSLPVSSLARTRGSARWVPGRRCAE